MDLPIFPLPELVLFPDVVIPLHIFESRYQKLVSDLIKKPEDSRMFVLATYTGQRQNLDFDDAPFHNIGTVCQLINHKSLPDGRSDILVHGVSTVVIDEINFLDIATPYRRVTIEPRETDWEIDDESELKQKILDSLNNYTARRRIEIIDLDNMKLREMTNLLSYALPFSRDEKFKLLETTSLSERVILLVRLLDVKYEYIDYTEKINDDHHPIN